MGYTPSILFKSEIFTLLFTEIIRYGNLVFAKSFRWQKKVKTYTLDDMAKVMLLQMWSYSLLEYALSIVCNMLTICIS